MSAGLAVVAILGGLFSLVVVRPTGLVAILLTLSVGGSLVTLATAMIADRFRGQRRSEVAAGDPTAATPRDVQPTSS